MEAITEGVKKVNINNTDNQKRNRIQVSNTKKSLFFYVNLAKVPHYYIYFPLLIVRWFACVRWILGFYFTISEY